MATTLKKVKMQNTTKTLKIGISPKKTALTEKTATMTNVAMTETIARTLIQQRIKMNKGTKEVVKIFLKLAKEVVVKLTIEGKVILEQQITATKLAERIMRLLYQTITVK